MRITVSYMAQLKRAAGLGREVVEVDGACTMVELLLRLAQDRGDSFRGLVLTSQGQPQPSLLLFVGEEQVRGDRPLRDGDEITVLTPMSGG
jgi:molybdopterin converting factor small subunit